MKILAFVDLHGNKSSLEKIIKKSKTCDLIICAGDISMFTINLNKIISKFKKTKKPLIIIPGNHESPQDLEKIKQDFLILLHKKIYRINNIVFIGYGTDGFSLKDKEFETFIKKVKTKLKKEDKIILITHGPPHNTKLDKLPYFGHVGNKSYTKAIKALNTCTQTHIGTKAISIMEDTYNILLRKKHKGESFSDVIRRITGKKKDIMQFAGTWKNTSGEDAEKMKKEIKSLRRRSTIELLKN